MSRSPSTVGRRGRILADVASAREKATSCRDRVTLQDGRRLERSADTPRGGDQNFASAADIVDKFEKLAVHALPKTRVAELRDAVLGLERLADAAALAALMVKP